MHRINMMIADHDSAYMKRLVGYLAENNKQLNISYFSDKQSLINHLKEDNTHIHILLFSEDMYTQELKEKRVDLKMMLSDSSLPISEDYKTINKYQRADDILNEILIAFSEATGTTEALGTTENGRSRAIAVYSPVGGSGKTTISLILAKTLSAQNRRVLYLNFEGVSSVKTVFQGDGYHSMSEVFLAAKTKKANVGLKVVQCHETDFDTGIEFINPPECAVEYSEMTPKELKRIVTETKELEQYDDIIIDMNSGYNDDIFEVLGACDVILTPYQNKSAALNKMKDFAEELEKLDKLENVGKKMVPIENCSNAVSCESFGGIYVRACVPETASLRNIDCVLQGDGSAAVRQIMAVLG